MNPPEFLEADAVQFLHNQSIREYGGYHGVRDENLLASALARPLDKSAYGTPDVFDLAAAYAFGIARNHAFNDGNKRTVWAVCMLSLKINGVGIGAPLDEIVGNVVALATGGFAETNFAAWLRERAV